MSIASNQNKHSVTRSPISCSRVLPLPPPNVYDKMIKITVGPPGGEAEFPVYRGVLCYYSEYFDRMLNGGFMESDSDHLRLEHADVDAFQCFYDWINVRTVHCSISPGDLNTDDWTKIMTVYLFADYYQVQGLKNSILDYACDIAAYFCQLPTRVTPLIYANTTDHHKVRQLVVDLAAQGWTNHVCEKEDIDLLDKEFLLDYITALKERKIPPGAPSAVGGWIKQIRDCFCERYHDHSLPEA